MATENPRYSGAAVQAKPDEDTELVYEIARGMYEQQATARGFTPQPEPYSPSWAFDYARIAIATMQDWNK